MIKDGLIIIKNDIEFIETTIQEVRSGDFTHRQLSGIFALMANKIKSLKNSIDCQIRYIDNVNSSEQNSDIKDDIPPF